MEQTDVQKSDLRQLVSALLEDHGRPLVSVSPDTDVAEAVRVMNENRIGSVVIQAGGLVRGIFTERDVLTRIVAERRNAHETKVEEVMTTDVIYVKPNATVEEAMVLMTERHFRHLPVLDGGRLYGLLSLGDLAHWLVRHQQYRIDELVQYVSGGYQSTIPPKIAREFPKRVSGREHPDS